jgi:DNA polymerase-3 subunit beta
VATDGYRLAEKRLTSTSSELAAIIPNTTLQEVSRVISDSDDTVEVLFDDTQVRLRVGASEITSRLIDGKYPDYRQLIPAKSDISATVATEELVRTAKIAGLFTRETGGSVTIHVDDEQKQFAVQSVATELGENMSTITAETNGSGDVSLNSRYLSEVLSVISASQVACSFSGKLSPIVIRPKDNNSDKDASYTHIIMPLKS